jgi:hypothetical protein
MVRALYNTLGEHWGNEVTAADGTIRTYFVDTDTRTEAEKAYDRGVRAWLYSL